MDIDHGLLPAQRQRRQQAGNQLRAALPVHIRTAREQRSLHRQRQVAVLFPAGAGLPVSGIRFIRIQADPEGGHDVVRTGKRPVQQGLLPRHADGAVPQRSQQRYHHPRQESRLTGMDGNGRCQAARFRPYTLDNQYAFIRIPAV